MVYINILFVRQKTLKNEFTVIFVNLFILVLINFENYLTFFFFYKCLILKCRLNCDNFQIILLGIHEKICFHIKYLKLLYMIFYKFFYFEKFYWKIILFFYKRLHCLQLKFLWHWIFIHKIKISLLLIFCYNSKQTTGTITILFTKRWNNHF